jgi:uncharacterized protein YggE
MVRTITLVPLIFLTGFSALWAQVQGTLATPTIQANGSDTVSVQPDQAQLTVSVSTDGATAQQAAQQNATQTNQVLSAVKQVLGTSGNVQTVGYAINPRYSNGANPNIIGYTAVNTIQVTTYDLSLPGPLIDAASSSGATNVNGLTFGLRNPDPVKQQALTAATKQALAHAGAIAAGLGGKVGPIVSAQESSTSTPVVMLAATSTSTPIQTGYVSVSASVVVTVQLQ